MYGADGRSHGFPADAIGAIVSRKGMFASFQFQPDRITVLVRNRTAGGIETENNSLAVCIARIQAYNNPLVAIGQVYARPGSGIGSVQINTRNGRIIMVGF